MTGLLAESSFLCLLPEESCCVKLRRELITLWKKLDAELGVYLDIGFALWHRSKVLQDLVAEADLEVLEPDAGLLVHVIVQLLQCRQLTAVLHLEELQFVF